MTTRNSYAYKWSRSYCPMIACYESAVLSFGYCASAGEKGREAKREGGGVGLHTCYAMSGTDIAYGASSLPAGFELSGTEICGDGLLGLWSYSFATRCPEIAWERKQEERMRQAQVANCLPACYAMSGTAIAYDSTSCYAMSGTAIAYDSTSSYAMSGNAIAYGATAVHRVRY
eukprot:827278-Rhodomonas_salina.7